MQRPESGDGVEGAVSRQHTQGEGEPNERRHTEPALYDVIK